MKSSISKTIAKGIANAIRLAGVLEVSVHSVSDFNEMLLYVDKIEATRGRLQAVKLWKYWYNHMARVAMGETDFDKPPFRQKLSNSGNPKIIKFLINYVENHKENKLKIRLLLTQLRAFDLVTCKATPDFSTILSESEGVKNYRSIEEEFREFLSYSPLMDDIKRNFLKGLEKLNDSRIPFHFTTKTGTSGSSLGTAGLQSMAIENNQEMKADLIRLSQIIFENSKDSFEDILEGNIQFYYDLEKDICKPKSLRKVKEILGKLAFIPDKGGKTRVIAIGNYWIQNTLKPIHQVLFDCLRRIAMDGTFDQISQSTRVAKATQEGPVWSFDLTAATDRIPLGPQIDIMKYLNEEIGEIWENILNNIDFEFKDRMYKYKVGQPMGLYTSWAMLATVHHAIIQFCAFKTGSQRTFMKYAVLGDDVAIWDREVAEEYERFMSFLDVDINRAKSYVPKKIGPYKAEFAKRLYLDGDELSGISPNVLREGMKSYWAMPEMFTFLVKHGLSEVDQIPISRVVKMAKLVKPNQIDELCCAFKVNELLGGVGLSQDVPCNKLADIQSLTLVKVMKNRVDLLSESVSNFYTDLFDIEEENREKLEKLHDSDDITDDLCINRVIDTRIQMMLSLEARMQKYIPEDWESNEMDFDVLLNQVKASDETEYEDNILTKIKDIEYLPSVKFEDLVKGITLHKDKKTYRVAYTKRLVKSIVSAAKSEQYELDNLGG